MMNILKPYKPVVASLLNQNQPQTILDVPCGSGWLGSMLDYKCMIDGIDLFAGAPQDYREFYKADLDNGLPDDIGKYDAIACCEGIAYFGNPELFFRSARNHLSDGGMLIVSTPSVWYPEARLQYWLRGFFPGFPCIVDKIKKETPMHIMPWSFAQLYLYLSLTGFSNITLHDIDEPRPRRIFEWLLGLPQYAYCIHKRRGAMTEEQFRFWSYAGSRQSLFGRHLVLSATAG